MLDPNLLYEGSSYLKNLFVMTISKVAQKVAGKQLSIPTTQGVRSFGP